MLDDAKKLEITVQKYDYILSRAIAVCEVG